jgi:hypothetical protein
MYHSAAAVPLPSPSPPWCLASTSKYPRAPVEESSTLGIPELWISSTSLPQIIACNLGNLWKSFFPISHIPSLVLLPYARYCFLLCHYPTTPAPCSRPVRTVSQLSLITQPLRLTEVDPQRYNGTYSTSLHLASFSNSNISILSFTINPLPSRAGRQTRNSSIAQSLTHQSFLPDVPGHCHPWKVLSRARAGAEAERRRPGPANLEKATRISLNLASILLPSQLASLTTRLSNYCRVEFLPRLSAA